MARWYDFPLCVSIRNATGSGKSANRFLFIPLITQSMCTSDSSWLSSTQVRYKYNSSGWITKKLSDISTSFVGVPTTTGTSSTCKWRRLYSDPKNASTSSKVLSLEFQNFDWSFTDFQFTFDEDKYFSSTAIGGVGNFENNQQFIESALALFTLSMLHRGQPGSTMSSTGFESGDPFSASYYNNISNYCSFSSNTKWSVPNVSVGQNIDVGESNKYFTIFKSSVGLLTCPYAGSTSASDGYNYTGCNTACTGLCQTTCSTVCYGNCTGSCTGGCSGSCTGGCTNSCAQSCSYDCGGSCTTMCAEGAINSGCTDCC